MASWGVEAAARRVAELEEELRGLAEELSSCQADKEFVWSLWKHLQVSSPDLMQAVGLVVEREKQKAEVKDRRVLELLEAKDSKIETLEQRLTGQHEEINNLMQRKNAVEEENACLKNEFSTLNQKFKDKSQELKDTEECAQKKEEQNRLVIKNLEEENKGLNTCCADLLSDLEKLRKQQAQWKMEKSGSDAIIKLYNELSLCFETVKTSEIQLQQSCASLQDHLLEKDKTICLLQVQLQEAYNASNAVHQNSSPKYQMQKQTCNYAAAVL